LNFAIALSPHSPISTSFLARLYDPTSPDYRHFLIVARFTEQFGPTAKDYQAVVDFAKAKGFTLTDTTLNRTLVDIRVGTGRERQGADE
jgi:subtilase family serine protease